MKDVGSFCHLHHEGGLACSQIIDGTNAGEDAISQADRAPIDAGTQLPIWASS